MFLRPFNYFTVFYSFIAFDSWYALLLKAATINLFTPLVCVFLPFCAPSPSSSPPPPPAAVPARRWSGLLVLFGAGSDVLSRHFSRRPHLQGSQLSHLLGGGSPVTPPPPPASRVISRRWSPPSPHLWRRLSESKLRITIRPHAPSLSV